MLFLVISAFLYLYLMKQIDAFFLVLACVEWFL